MATKFLTHLNPILSDRANFIIHAKCSTGDGPTDLTFEQLWSREIDDNHFEICCIPFFVYDLALGDEVITGSEGGMQYIVQRVVKPSGHYTFRVWFGDSPEPSTRDEVIAEVTRLGGLMEWYSRNLLGIDAASESQAQEIADFLYHSQQLGHLVYETGRMQEGSATPMRNDDTAP